MKKAITAVIIFSMMILNVFPVYANVSSTKEAILIQRNSVKYENLTYTGLTFRCQSKIDVVKCWYCHM
ncbi:MAG: hypothetical protein GX053_00380 [Tissierella sp.]|nr:hypothetical protein [Tissierella sp.]